MAKLDIRITKVEADKAKLLDKRKQIDGELSEKERTLQSLYKLRDEREKAKNKLIELDNNIELYLKEGKE